MKTLYVEDDLNDAELTINALKKSGEKFSVTLVQNYKDAFKTLTGPSGKEYDLVLCDKNLPDGNGLELLAAVRSAKIPVAFVLITGQGDENSAVAALRSGTDDYIIKQNNYLKHLPKLLIKAKTGFKNRLNQPDKNFHVLYIENIKEDADLTIRHMHDHAPHIHMTVVKSAAMAIKKISSPEFSRSFDVILLNFNLPETSALKLITKIKQKAVINIPVVLIGDHGSEENVVQALKSGASDFLIKTPDYLMRLPTKLENVNNFNQLKKEKEALSESEKRFRVLTENTIAGVYMVQNNKFIYVNTALMNMTGYDRSELINEDVFHFIHPDDHEDAKEYIKRRMEGQVADTRYDLRAIKKDGSIISLDIWGTLIQYNGQPTFIATVLDITEQKKLELEQRQIEERYRTAFKTGLDAQYIATLEDGLIIETNPQFKDVFGYEIDEAIGKTSRELNLYEDYSVRAKIVAALEENGVVNNLEAKARKKNGEIIWCSLSITLMEINEKKLMHGVARDITEVKRATDVLQQREKKYRFLFEAVPVGISISNTRGRIISANSAMQEIMGYTEEELQNFDLYDLYLDRDMRNQLLDTVQQSGKVRDFQVDLKRKDGTIFTVLFNIDLIEYDGNEAYLTVCRDISAQNQIRKQLHTSNKQLSRILNNLQDAYFQADASGKFVMVNPRAVSMYGYDSADEIIGLPTTALDSDKHERKLLQEALKKSDSIDDLITKGKRKNGSTFWVSMNIKRLKDEAGNYIGTEGVVRDISERKKNEEEIKQRNAELLTLNQIGQSLSRLANESEITERIFTEIGKVVDNRNFYIALYDKENQYIQYPVYTINGKRMTNRHRPLANGITDYVIRNNTILLINHDFLATLQKNGIELRGKPPQSLVAVPMTVNEEVIGVITLQDYDRENIYDDHHIDLLTTIAAQASSALQNAKLYGQVQLELNDLRIAEETLLERDIELLESQKIAHLGTFIFDTSSGLLKTSELMDELVGVDKTYNRSLQEWTALIHPEDRDMMIDFLRNELIAKKLEGEKEFRIVRKNDGKIRWLYIHNNVDVNAKGEVIRIRGTSQDITQRKQMENSLRRSEELFRNSFENAHVGVSLVSSEGNFLRVNNELCNILGYPIGELIVIKFNDITLEEDKHIGQSYLRRMIDGEIDNASFEKRYVRKNGQVIWVFLSIAAIRDDEGNFSHFIVYTQDISEQKKYEEKIEQNNMQLRETFKGAINLLALAGEQRDPYTAGHQERVAKLAVAIAKKMGLDEHTIEGINIAGIIHDVGKMSVPVELLSKPTKLTELEYSIIKTHSQSGYQILSKVDFPWPIADIVYQHHEHLDGSGYPRGLKSDEILIEAKILAVADVVEAMSSNRPYRASMGITAALEEISNKKDVYYDPGIVETCKKLFIEEAFNF